MSRGQIFTLDLFVSLIIVVVVLSISTVLIDRTIDERFQELSYLKMQTIAEDVAAYRYYEGSLPNIPGYKVLSSPQGSQCVSAVRGGSGQVFVYVCK